MASITDAERSVLKQKVLEAIERRSEEIIAIGDDIFAHPELGYKEFRTAEIVQRHFAQLGIPYRGGIGITGVKSVLGGGKSNVRLAVMGELDSVLCPEHPHADPQTGAAHSCGHHGQIAALVGVAMGLVDAGVMPSLGGDIVLIAVPAEEYVEIEYRAKLRREGKISFLGGKQEFIALGEMDDVDLAMMVHMGAEQDGKKVVTGGSSNGFVGKFIRYKGKEAHAGGAPHDGINALNAAMLGLMGIHANRETLKDDDTIRIHPIVTRGGDLVNIIPADVRMETYVRGKRMEAVLDASRKVNRALRAGAMAVGAEVEIEEIPGYMPQLSEQRMTELFRANAVVEVGEDAVKEGGHGTGSTDMGDLTQIMPGIQPSVAGAGGIFHSKSFTMVDQHLAYVVQAKLLAATAIDLLAGDAAEAQALVKTYRPNFTKDAYLSMWESFFSE
ncbi:MAG: amidohydrolase [Bacillota bacterium]|nr:amidohydrolase [Bacillota bacterium]